jgi:hypothetical protein
MEQVEILGAIAKSGGLTGIDKGSSIGTSP